MLITSLLQIVATPPLLRNNFILIFFKRLIFLEHFQPVGAVF
jgi:hypothetical protein